eukprot:1225731-Pyramimonas_sp.AAC.1
MEAGSPCRTPRSTGKNKFGSALKTDEGRIVGIQGSEETHRLAGGPHCHQNGKNPFHQNRGERRFEIGE